MSVRTWLVVLLALLWVSMVHAGNNVWTSLGPESAGTSVVIAPTTPTTLYAGTFGHGLYKSTDGGSSWSAVNTGLPINVSIDRLAIDPNTPTTLYARIQGGGSGSLFKSTNGGSSWSVLNTTGLPSNSINHLTIAPTT